MNLKRVANAIAVTVVMLIAVPVQIFSMAPVLVAISEYQARIFEWPTIATVERKLATTTKEFAFAITPDCLIEGGSWWLSEIGTPHDRLRQRGHR